MKKFMALIGVFILWVVTQPYLKPPEVYGPPRPPTKAELAYSAQLKAEADEPVLKADAERIVRAVLRDPDSARFGSSIVRNGTVCGYVNAKNAFGGYTGPREFLARKGYALVNDGSEVFRKEWNKRCA
jgi:hypothetical protein